MMEEITNYNCEGLCVERVCSRKYTHYVTLEISKDIKYILPFCKPHAYQCDVMESLKNGMNEFHKNSKGVFEIICKDRGITYEFYCPYCVRTHRHGSEDGYRTSHCVNDMSPLYGKNYYILKENDDDFGNNKYDEWYIELEKIVEDDEE